MTRTASMRLPLITLSLLLTTHLCLLGPEAAAAPGGRGNSLIRSGDPLKNSTRSALTRRGKDGRSPLRIQPGNTLIIKRSPLVKPNTTRTTRQERVEARDTRGRVQLKSLATGLGRVEVSSQKSASAGKGVGSRIKEWWRWSTRKDWVVKEIRPNPNRGILSPDNFVVWEDLRTGNTRVTKDHASY